ncbi:hypothetical protein BpHYR1_016903 [Brachionus plicatilis]|uniref:Uncharacterized protein n=1 Tax=Brachionus plicatilis TaxID=10195 RepID=A0A3M7RG07_BRAPC|nr:hypothetical protein BpHYR1_016903 [Brachionus plicatilis]
MILNFFKLKKNTTKKPNKKSYLIQKLNANFITRFLFVVAKVHLVLIDKNEIEFLAIFFIIKLKSLFSYGSYFIRLRNCV